jgi:hypothetical protein
LYNGESLYGIPSSIVSRVEYAVTHTVNADFGKSNHSLRLDMAYIVTFNSLDQFAHDLHHIPSARKYASWIDVV